MMLNIEIPLFLSFFPRLHGDTFVFLQTLRFLFSSTLMSVLRLREELLPPLCADEET